MKRFICRRSKSQRLKRGETFADENIVTSCFFPMMRLHLRVNEFRELSLVILKNILHLILRGHIVPLLCLVCRASAELQGTGNAREGLCLIWCGILKRTVR